MISEKKIWSIWSFFVLFNQSWKLIRLKHDPNCPQIDQNNWLQRINKKSISNVQILNWCHDYGAKYVNLKVIIRLNWLFCPFISVNYLTFDIFLKEKLLNWELTYKFMLFWATEKRLPEKKSFFLLREGRNFLFYFDDCVGRVFWWLFGFLWEKMLFWVSLFLCFQAIGNMGGSDRGNFLGSMKWCHGLIVWKAYLAYFSFLEFIFTNIHLSTSFKLQNSKVQSKTCKWNWMSNWYQTIITNYTFSKAFHDTFFNQYILHHDTKAPTNELLIFSQNFHSPESFFRTFELLPKDGDAKKLSRSLNFVKFEVKERHKSCTANQNILSKVLIKRIYISQTSQEN